MREKGWGLSNRFNQDYGRRGRQEWLFALMLLQPAAVSIMATTYPWAGPLTLLQDPFKISETVSPLHPLMGALSSFGAMMFFCSSAIALFGAMFATKRSDRRFLIYAGIYSSFLGTDDLFGLHENVLFEFSIKENYVKLAYFVAQVVYILAFYKVILKLNYLPLLGALLLFAASMVLDSPVVLVIQNVILNAPVSPATRELSEDLPKLVGTVLWLWFHMQAAAKIVAEWRPQNSDSASQQGEPE